jgi:3-deoxy-7-phosphoheptulonate synthase
MVVVMAPGADETQIQEVTTRIEMMGLAVHRSTGEGRTILGCVGDPGTVEFEDIRSLPGVLDVVQITRPFKLVSRVFQPENTIVQAGPAVIGGNRVAIMAGPCAVESEEQTVQAAEVVAGAGAGILRGGAFKPRTSPYTFQGLGEEGLRILRRTADRFGLAVVTEVLDAQHVELVERYADILQIGTRNMQNFQLLRQVGKSAKPVMLKRGLSATMEEWLLAAEYILSGGNRQVILCERGIRTFETYTRNTLDLSCVPVIQELSHLPVVVDPSHATGIRDKVPPLARAAVAAGADGIMVEVHPQPDRALSDGAQSLYPAQFEDMMLQCRAIAETLGREL